MAKKNLNLRSTLSKNKATEKPLPEKVTFKKSKTSKDLEKVKEKVEAIHKDETKEPKTLIKTKKTKVVEKEENVRITIDLPKSLHKKLKLHAVMNEITIREFVVGLLEKQLRK